MAFELICLNVFYTIELDHLKKIRKLISVEVIEELMQLNITDMPSIRSSYKIRRDKTSSEIGYQIRKGFFLNLKKCNLKYFFL